MVFSLILFNSLITIIKITENDVFAVISLSYASLLAAKVCQILIPMLPKSDREKCETIIKRL